MVLLVLSVPQQGPGWSPCPGPAGSEVRRQCLPGATRGHHDAAKAAQGRQGLPDSRGARPVRRELAMPARGLSVGAQGQRADTHAVLSPQDAPTPSWLDILPISIMSGTNSSPESTSTFPPGPLDPFNRRESGGWRGGEAKSSHEVKAGFPAPMDLPSRPAEHPRV